MIPTTYLLTVALHAAVLSVFASAILLVVRQARYRAVIAICGLLAVALLPWITALRPAPAPAVVAREISAAPRPAASGHASSRCSMPNPARKSPWGSDLSG